MKVSEIVEIINREENQGKEVKITYVRKNKEYETSILPYEDCCTIFVPKHPVIHPNLKTALEYEKLIDKNELIYNAIKNETIININSNNKEYQDLL